MIAACQLAETVGVARACAALELPRASFYRHGRIGPPAPPKVRPTPARALTPQERIEILGLLNSEPFMDQPPRQVYATLLDRGHYVCSVRTLYRLLEDAGQVRERRDQLRHPTYQRPQLVATAPNQVWSWDITKLLGPAKWTYFYLYVLLDIFSRYVVGWTLALRESCQVAAQLIDEACQMQGIQPGQLTVHADRGGPMTSKSLALLFADLGITKSHSRPYVSDDNPYSEAHFKTMKYRPGFPDRFGSIEHGRDVLGPLFHWYNHEHHHTGLNLLTPASVHAGLAHAILEQRNAVLATAYSAHPERFVRKAPHAGVLPTAAWICPPNPIELAQPGLPGRSDSRSSILNDPGASTLGQLSSNAAPEPVFLEAAAH